MGVAVGHAHGQAAARRLQEQRVPIAQVVDEVLGGKATYAFVLRWDDDVKRAHRTSNAPAIFEASELRAYSGASATDRL